jgi:hypothetical protein
MQRTLRAAAFAMVTGLTLSPVHAADVLYPPPHTRPHPHRHAYLPPYPQPHLPRPGWVLMPGIAYAPIAPIDFSLATGEYYSRLWEPFPFCCPDPYYYPAVLP